MQTDTFKGKKRRAFAVALFPALYPVGLFLKIILTCCKIIFWYFLRACFVQGSE